jgi:hypothetical protein
LENSLMEILLVVRWGRALERSLAGRLGLWMAAELGRALEGSLRATLCVMRLGLA